MYLRHTTRRKDGKTHVYWQLVRSVRSGAQDPEQIDDARANAPLRVLTLERVVSLRDYQDFARAFGGIAKALASWS